jgi:hypothetical protein
VPRGEAFGNGRYARQLLDQAIEDVPSAARAKQGS